MTPSRMEARLIALGIRYERMGGYANALALVHQPGRWSITCNGGTPALKGTGPTPDEAFQMAEAALTNAERQRLIAKQHKEEIAA